MFSVKQSTQELQFPSVGSTGLHAALEETFQLAKGRSLRQYLQSLQQSNIISSIICRH